jgi:hypothetical protein
MKQVSAANEGMGEKRNAYAISVGNIKKIRFPEI